MKYLIFLAFVVYTNHSEALVIWPGTSAPCNTTLDACVDGSPTGETIEIRTNAVIDESISSFKAISLVAGIGYKSVFAADRHIEITGNSNPITIEGLTLLRGRISFNASGLNTFTQLNIKNNHIMDNNFNTGSIRVLNLGDNQVELNIAFNQVTYNLATTSSVQKGAINIINGLTTGAATSGELTGRIYNNKITSFGPESVGVALYEYTNCTSDLKISSNEFSGGQLSAAYFSRISRQQSYRFCTQCTLCQSNW